MAKVATDRRKIRQLRLHGDIIKALSSSSVQMRNRMLRDASPELVEALGTACQLAHELGFVPPRHHAARFAKMKSPNAAKRTKWKAVTGGGKQSRGGGLFDKIGSFLSTAAPLALAAL